VPMDPSKFTSTEAGEVVQVKSNSHGVFHSFKPKPLWRSLALSEPTIVAMAEAEAALGRLSGAGRLLTEPELLVEPYMFREALASSRIEGTQANLSDVLQAAASAGEGSSPHAPVQEVENYVAALRMGVKAMHDGQPIDRDLILRLHAVLMDGVRGQDGSPGQLRQRPNWIASPTQHPASAVYVPPAITDWLNESFTDFLSLVDTQPSMPLLVQCALLHYYFETIHPFIDGNGRVGRLLIVLYLMRHGRLTQPLLYVSGFLELNRREYYDRMQAVRERAEVQEWLQFFFTAVRTQAIDAVDRAERLFDLREETRRRIGELTRSRALEIIDHTFVNPYVSVPRVSALLGISAQGAGNIVRQLEEFGWLSPMVGLSSPRYWYAEKVLDIVEDIPLLATTVLDDAAHVLEQTDSNPFGADDALEASV
jgi:Fic family protein